MTRQLLLIVAVVVLIRLPFLNQAVQGDDVYYLAQAQHAQIDPAHPKHFQYLVTGIDVDFTGFPHPPLDAWMLGALLFLFGDIREIPFHAAYIVLSLIAAISMLSLARRFSAHPVWATLLFVAAPAFVINGGSFESDLPFLAFWMLGITLFIRAVDQRSIPLLAAAALGLALAAMASYQAFVSAPILFVYLWYNQRRWIPAWVASLTAPIVVAVYQIIERQSTGSTPAFVLAGYLSKYGFEAFRHKIENALALTSHTGWIVFPVLAIWVFRASWIWGLAAALGGVFIDANPLFWLSFAAGVMVIASCVHSKPDFLEAWVVIFFAFALAVFFAGSARYLLPMAAPVILIVSRQGRWLRSAFAAQLTVSLALAVVNYEHWEGYRQFANALKTQAANKRVWVNGEWGLRYYFEAEGALPVARGQAIHPGDMLITSDLSYPVAINAGGGRLTPVAEKEISAVLPLRLIALHTKSGYSTATYGYRPFDVSSGPIDRVRAQVVIERVPTASYLTMNSPDAPGQIVSGLYELESTWRWMGEKAVILLKPPPKPEAFHVAFVIPDPAPARRMTVWLDGAVISDETYPKPGSYNVATKPVTGSTVTIALDKTFTVPGDGRQLGVVISELGFR